MCSAGNGHQNGDNSNKDAYANSRYTVAVGAVNWKGERPEYSESGSIMLVAPSHNSSTYIDPAIFSTDIVGTEGHNNTDYLTIGTIWRYFFNSHGLGVIALMLEANPDLTSAMFNTY